MSLSQLLYYQIPLVELADEETGKPVEVLRTGVFTDRNGKEVEITTEDLDTFVANFEAGAAGQEVPIDINHEREEAGGWIKSLARKGETLLATIDWNKLGREKVGEKIYRYMSATIDLANKVIKSVSLVNFPAVKGLKPVELSEGVFVLEQQGFFDAIQEMVNKALGKQKPIELADGVPGSVTISQFLQASMHKVFTNIADNLALSGYLSDEERKQLSGAIGDALDTFSSNVGEPGTRLIPSAHYYSHEAMYSQANDSEVTEMTEQEKEALREQIRAEEREKVAAELSEKAEQEAELREQIRKEEREKAEAQLKEKFEKRQSLVEFANEVCGNDGVALSATPEKVVEFLEAQPNETALETAKELLKAKVVEFEAPGSNGKGRGTQLKKLPDHVRQDVLDDEHPLTIKEIFEANVLPGEKMEDYDLSEFSADQKGF